MCMFAIKSATLRLVFWDDSLPLLIIIITIYAVLATPVSDASTDINRVAISTLSSASPPFPCTHLHQYIRLFH